MNSQLKDTKNTLFSTKPMNIDQTALLARLVFGGFIIMGHGRYKIEAWMNDRAGSFYSGLEIHPEFELLLAIFAEVLCGLAVLIGFQTRLAAIPLIIAMFVATVFYHWQDPFFYLPKFGSNKEFAAVYGIGFILIFLLGSGKYSIDHLLNKNKTTVNDNE